MKVKANVSFSGRISMAKGEKRDITDESLLKDLLAAGYVSEIATAQKKDVLLEQKEDVSEESKTDPPDQKEAEPEDEGK